VSLKTILVHVEADPDGDRRVRLALDVAGMFQASITGVGAEAFDPVMATGIAGADGAVLQAVRKRIAIDLPAAERRFRELVAGREGDSWIACEDYPVKVLALESRGADLIIAGRPARGEGSTFAANPAELVLEAGGAVLLAADGDARFKGDHVIVAWKDTRESRRALADALPFLTRATGVIVVCVSGEGNGGGSLIGLRDVVRRLSRHGVHAEFEIAPKGRGSVAQALGSAADRHGADLIVSGAYGHARMREWALGGVTQDLIAGCSKFLLLSH
jgi:nucleotide-binding universal stress UspA family protein